MRLGFGLFVTCIMLSYVSMSILRQNTAFNEPSKQKCPQYLDNLSQLVKRSEVVVAGRMRERIGSHSLGMGVFRQTFSKGPFNVIILVTDYYKNFTAVMDYIQVGELFITNDKSAGKTGCLDVFYKNSKYIFFLKNAITSRNTTYQVIANPIRFKEQISAMIRALICSGCYAPTIEKLTNQQLQHGSTLTMTCAVKGRPRPVILWLKNGRSINLADKGITVEQIRPSDEDTESVLEITNVIRIDSGEYKCLASNHLGEASATFSLRVSQSGVQQQTSMTSELVECGVEHNDYCLNGGQCYMIKADREVLQCSCNTPFYGAHCERTAVDISDYNRLETLLSRQTKLVAVFGALFVTVFLLLIVLSIVMWCQSRTDNVRINWNHKQTKRNKRRSPPGNLLNQTSDAYMLNNSESEISQHNKRLHHLHIPTMENSNRRSLMDVRTLDICSHRPNEVNSSGAGKYQSGIDGCDLRHIQGRCSDNLNRKLAASRHAFDQVDSQYCVLGEENKFSRSVDDSMKQGQPFPLPIPRGPHYVRPILSLNPDMNHSTHSCSTTQHSIV